jgi:hypothetical protein
LRSGQPSDSTLAWSSIAHISQQSGEPHASLSVQQKYGVRYLRYWYDAVRGLVFCLADAPDKEAALAVHREAHGLMPDDIFEVQEFE